MRAVVLGATKGMGRALARLMAERGDALFLLGRDGDDLARSAADLQIRGAAGTVGVAHCDLLDAGDLRPGARRRRAARSAGSTPWSSPPGCSPARTQLEQDAELRDRLLTADFTNTIHFCELARERLLAGGGAARLCVFSSVAGDRARKPVLLYGAAKAGLSYYLNGLDHKFAAQGLRTILVKPGFVKTGMMAGLPVAAVRRRARARSRASCCAPSTAARRWSTRRRSGAGSCWSIRMLPRAVMRRIGF